VQKKGKRKGQKERGGGGGWGGGGKASLKRGKKEKRLKRKREKGRSVPTPSDIIKGRKGVSGPSLTGGFQKELTKHKKDKTSTEKKFGGVISAHSSKKKMVRAFSKEIFG